jgi:hypothetical protein
MPRVSLVGDGHGGSEDYATLVLWWASESGIDYGSKIEAVGSGDCGLSTLMITGVTPNGYDIYAKTGEAFDGTNEITCPQSGGVVLESDNGSFSGLACTGSGSTKGMSQTGQDTVVEFNFITHDGTGDAANQNSAATNKIMRNNVIKGVGNFAFVANSNTFLNQLENNTVIGNSAWGILASNSSVLIQNNFSFGHATNDINSNTGAFVTNATQDTSGNSGLTGFTSAELVDFANGDYRTKATSTLATAGTGSQGFIGAFLEAGELSITASTPSYSFTVPDADVTLTGELSITASTPSYSFTVPNADVTLTGELSITASTPSYSFTVPNADVTLTGDLVIVVTTPSYSYQAVKVDVTFSGGPCQILHVTGEVLFGSLQYSGIIN